MTLAKVSHPIFSRKFHFLIKSGAQPTYSSKFKSYYLHKLFPYQSITFRVHILAVFRESSLHFVSEDLLNLPSDVEISP